MVKSIALVAFLAAGLLVACGGNEQPTASAQPADLLLRSVAQAVAVKDGLILAVGSDAELQALQGPDTEVIDLQGRMLLPGLQDSHIHIFGIVEPDVCSLRSQPMKLDDMVPYLQECVQRYALPPGEWLSVDMWNFAEGNQVSEQYPNLRAALDVVSSEHPIILWGNDGHHGAVNSRALATARDAQGSTLVLSAATLATVFAEFGDRTLRDAEQLPGAQHGGLWRGHRGRKRRARRRPLAAALRQHGDRRHPPGPGRQRAECR
jgi:hypothetical protein